MRGEPDGDEAVKGEIRDDVLGREKLVGGGTGIVAGFEPPLDTGTVVGDAGAETHRRPHDVERNGTPEMSRHGNEKLFLNHIGIYGG